jgi:methyl-accepting chemotaxis protein
MEDYEKEAKSYSELGFENGAQDYFDASSAKWSEFKLLGSEIVSLFKSGKPEASVKLQGLLLKDSAEKAKNYTVAMKALLGYHEATLKSKKSSASDIASSAFGIVVLIILSGLVTGLAVGFIFAQRISRAIGHLAKNLGQGADHVSHAAEKIANSAQGLSKSATQQASSLEETVSTMEELTAMVRLNTDNAKQAASLASSTRDIAVKGEREIKTLIDSINSISADSKKIEEITNVIDDIAFQTNLLALNAAVEAARAGEQGKGFAVVAEAVRSLAQRSSLAAKDIAELIKNSVQKIELGSKQASQGGEVLGDIVNSVKKVADLNNEISNASEEQNTGIMQISQAMNQLDQITQSNAAASEETAQSAENLSAQSKTLSVSVSSLESVITGVSPHNAQSDFHEMTMAVSKTSRPGQRPVARHSGRAGKASNVLEMKTFNKSSKKGPSANGSAVIPFDEDYGGQGKVGTTDGF